MAESCRLRPQKGKLVLVVSCDSVTRDLLAVILKKDGYAVEEVETILEAKLHLATSVFFACIVDGRSLFSAGRELLRGLNAKPAFLAVLADEEDGELLTAAAAAGAAAVVTQPFQRNAILQVLKNLDEPADGRQAG